MTLYSDSLRVARQLPGRCLVPALLALTTSLAHAALPATLVETPMLRDEVAAKKLPPVRPGCPRTRWSSRWTARRWSRGSTVVR